MILLRDMQDARQVEEALLLDRVGFTPTEIAKLLDTSQNSTLVALSKTRKSRKRTKAAKKKASKKRARK